MIIPRAGQENSAGSFGVVVVLFFPEFLLNFEVIFLLVYGDVGLDREAFFFVLKSWKSSLGNRHSICGSDVGLALRFEVTQRSIRLVGFAEPAGAFFFWFRKIRDHFQPANHHTRPTKTSQNDSCDLTTPSTVIDGIAGLSSAFVVLRFL